MKFTQEEQDRLNEQLFDAIENNDLNEVKTAIAIGAEINAKDKKRNTPLLRACNKNILINERWEMYKETYGYEDCSADLTLMKKDEGHAWLREAESTALQSSIRALDTAFKNFWERPECGYPKLKKKRGRQSYTSKAVKSEKTGVLNIRVNMDRGTITMPKLGEMRAVLSREPEGRIISATLSCEPDGRYYISLCCTDIEPETLPATGKAAGADLGIKTLAVSAQMAYDAYIADDKDAEIIPESYGMEPMSNKDKRHLRRLSRSLSRKQKGSRNAAKVANKLAVFYRKQRDKRNDTLQKATTKLVKENDIICVEDLHVKGMLKNHRLADAAQRQAFGNFVRMLQYKAEWRGATVVKVSRWFPSSKRCSVCGYHNDGLTLKDREWTCPECKTSHDRDLNAAVNILNEGLCILTEQDKDAAKKHTGTCGMSSDKIPRKNESRSKQAIITAADSPLSAAV